MVIQSGQTKELEYNPVISLLINMRGLSIRKWSESFSISLEKSEALEFLLATPRMMLYRT